MASHVKATVKKKGGKGKAHRMTIEKAHNGGFITNTHFPPAKGARGMETYPDPETNAHSDMAALQDHIGQTFGDQPANEGAAPEGKVEDNDNDGE